LPACLAIFLLFMAMSGPAFSQESGKKLNDAVREARAAGILESTVNRLLMLGYEKGLKPQSTANLLHLLTEAWSESLPLDPLVNKIEEGVTKGVPGPVIEQVVLKKLEDYRLTRRALLDYLNRRSQKNPFVPTDCLIRMTESLYCGLSREDLNRVLEGAPTVSLLTLAEGFEVLAALRQMRFTPDLAEEIVFVGIRQNGFTANARDFIRVVGAAKKKPVPEDRIAAAAKTVLEQNLSLRELCKSLKVSPEDLEQACALASEDLPRVAPELKSGGAGNRSGREKDTGR
jgi:hypothetical protein